MALLSACTEVDPPELADEADDGIVIEDDDETETETGTPDLPEAETETDSEDNPPSCSSTTAVADAIPPNVMLVLDKSRSMVVNTWDDDGLPQTDDVTRWHSLHQTVATVAEQYSQGMSLGLTLFPSIDATSAYSEACLVESTPEVPVGPNGASELLAAIPGADDLDLFGATPAASGIDTAYNHLLAIDDGRPRAMILVTDGAANCSVDHEGAAKFDVYDEDLPMIVAEAWQAGGIPTYVVGIDIEETSEHPFTKPREKLDEVAQLGGVPRAGEVGFYDARDAEALMVALDEIAASVSCTVQLGQEPDAADRLLIFVGGNEIPYVESCAEGYGWTYVNPDAGLDRIELCEAACEEMLDAGEVEAEFLCPPVG